MAPNPIPTPDTTSSTTSSKTFSCVRCFERKVKCNKENPCSACIRSRVECVFRNPAPARRRKKRSQEDILQARLTKYENLLKSHGLNPDDATAHERESGSREGDGGSETFQETGSQDSPAGPRRPPETGRLYVDHGKSTFLENSLWTSLSGEIDEPRDILPESEDEGANDIPLNDPFRVDLVLGYTPTTPDTATLHPSPDHILKLWQLFLENVNPLTKIIHHPTVETTLLEVAFDVRKAKKNFEPLMFAIYATTITSLTDVDCQRIFGEYRVSLIARYSLGMRQTLMRARFLGTSELSVLQAYVLYLFAMRPFYRTRTVWVLAGVATRIAQGMGLHRDGSSLGLPIFETELRRRLWWQLIILDSRSAELTGSSFKPGHFMDFTTKLPLNVNDSEIYPNMQEQPVEHTKPTEMIGCLVRYALGEFRRNRKGSFAIGRDDTIYSIASPIGGITQADKMIDDLEKHLEETYLRYLDPSIPIQFHASIVGRAAVNTMRLMAHHPLHYNTDQKDSSKIHPAERELLFLTSLKVIECDNLLHSTKSTQRFLWHVHFQWHAFIYLLSDLRARPEGDQAERAWRQVDEVFEHHPDFISEYRRALYIAVGNLTLKAWNARERVLSRQSRGFMTSETPEFIVLLRKQRVDAKPFRGPTMNSMVTPPYNAPLMRTDATSSLQLPGQELLGDQSFDINMEFDPSLLADTPTSGSEPMDWSQWDNLLQEFDIPR